MLRLRVKFFRFMRLESLKYLEEKVRLVLYLWVMKLVGCARCFGEVKQISSKSSRREI